MRGDCLTFEDDASGGGRQHAQHGKSCRRLARPALADETSVSPRRIVNETPSNRLDGRDRCWIRIPLVTGKWTFKSSTRRIGSSAATVVGKRFRHGQTHALA